MGRTRQTRRAERCQRRPLMECLESRELLSTSSGASLATVQVVPADSSSTSSSSSSGTDYNSIVGATQVQQTYGVNGSGMTVAVIDTGVNYNNEALGGGFGPGDKVVAGYDFADSSSDPNATVDQHGTAVAGIIASDDPTNPGVAPGADIAALKVFNNSNQGSYTWVADALQWVITNHAEYNITAVNLSLSDGGNYTQNVFAQDGGIGQQITGLISQLDALNIPVISATGNSFTGTQGEGFTAIVPDSISVTATNGSGQFLSNAQRLGTALGGASATKIAAPGSGIVAPVAGNSFASGDGTSFAAPIVTGGIVLLQQIYEQRFGQLPTVNQIDDWLEQGADPIYDPTTGITIGQLDLPNSAALIPAAPSSVTSTPEAQTLNPPVTSTPQATPTVIATSTPTPTPSPTPTPTPSPTPTPTPSPTPTSTQQSTSTSQATTPSSRLASLLSLFSNLFKSLTSPSAGTGSSASSFAGFGNAQSWTAATATVGQAEPTGVLTPLTPHLAGGSAHSGHSGFVQHPRSR